MAISAAITITTTSGTLRADFHVSIHVVGGKVRKWGYLCWASSGATAMRGPELGPGCKV
jgi:hypothetical protein